MKHTSKPARPALAKLTGAMQRTLDEALAKHQQGAVGEAMVGYRQVLAAAPGQLDALMNLGAALAEQGKAREAAALLRRAREAAPRLARVHLDAGTSFAALGCWSDAISSFEAARALEPSLAAAWEGLGRVLIEVGREEEARPVIQRALKLDSTAASAWFLQHLALFDERQPGPAIEALTQAVVADLGLVWARFCLGVCLDLAGKRSAALQQFAALHPDKQVFAGAVDSWHYMRERRTPETRVFVTTRSLLRFALEQASVDGLSLEFGTRYGVSARWIAEAQPDRTLHGFDSFQGLPEKWHDQPSQLYSTHGELPEVPASVHLHVGLFDATLGPFAQAHPGPIRFLHVDCDLYSSTRAIFDALAGRIVPGTIIVFDEYLVNDRWREDEYKAFQECVARCGWSYEYLAFSVVTGQAAVRIR